MENIILVINNIPMILQYFVSGFCFLIIFLHLSSKKIDTIFFILLSCVLSYIFIIIVQILCQIQMLSDIANSIFLITGCAILIAIVCAIIASKVVVSNWFNTLLLKYFHKTFHTDIWRDILDFETGTNLSISIKDSDYEVIGHYNFHEEKGKESWIALSGYVILDKETKEIKWEKMDYRDDLSKIFLICLDNVSHIEVL